MKVFYCIKQNVAENTGFSPSAGKPALLMEYLGNPEVTAPKPCTRSMISLAHSTEYVHGILAGKLTNGFGNNSLEVAASLPWTTGSMVSAAIHAVKTGESAMSLTSGFHHAHYASAQGFCTFNGLVIAAQVLRVRGMAGKVGILDMDEHAGNGTEEIIKKLDLSYISHWSLGYSDVSKGKSAKLFLRGFAKLIKEKFSDCDVLLYQAGADCHVNDPLGGRFTTEEMQERDRIVFETARELKIPVAWNLAGGYQNPIEKVLELHANTLRECSLAERTLQDVVVSCNRKAKGGKDAKKIS